VIAEILFYLFATVLVLAAVGVIASRNPVYSALYLVLAFVQSAALWLLIEAEFLAVVLVLVYVGAVMVLFLFVVMMLDINIEEMRQGFTRYLWLGAAVALGVIAEIGYVLLLRAEGLEFLSVPEPSPADYSNATELGAALFTEHIYAFEIAGMILLLAIVAAISLTMRKREGLKVQDVSAQVAVRRQDRIRIAQVEATRE
jgi:NADH-quinone oxidoreductase subunit J